MSILDIPDMLPPVSRRDRMPEREYRRYAGERSNNRLPAWRSLVCIQGRHEQCYGCPKCTCHRKLSL